MAFNATLEMTTKDIAKVTLSGELDGSVAYEFKAVVESAVEKEAKRLVLLMQDLEYMSSAGLRVLIFARQKMDSAADIYLVGAQEMVLEVIKMAGFHYSVTLLDEYDPSVIEAV